MNQGGNQGDDSTGQHYSVTEHTLHMLIRPGEREKQREEDGQMEGGMKRWRFFFKKSEQEEI